MYDLGLRQALSLAHVPAHHQRGVNHIVAWNQVQNGIGTTSDCAEDSLQETRQETEVA